MDRAESQAQGIKAVVPPKRVARRLALNALVAETHAPTHGFERRNGNPRAIVRKHRSILACIPESLAT